MSKVKLFLGEKKVLLFSMILILFIFRCTFFLGNLDPVYFYMSMHSSLFFLFLYLLLSYYYFEQKLSVVEENAKWKEEKAEFEANCISHNKELEDYFLLWVHQIKTPITVSKLLLKEGETKKEKEMKLQLYFIEQYTDMAMNYLKLTKYNTDMDVTSVNLDSVIKEILKKFSFLFHFKGIKLEYSPIGKEMNSDTKWISILIEQILSNALKYTERGSIFIYFEKEKQSLVIKDTGIGIREEDIPKIFDKGYSGFNGRLNQKSSGLGLFLAKKIAERLKIVIRCESKIGVGSLFFIQFQEENDSLTFL